MHRKAWSILAVLAAATAAQADVLDISIPAQGANYNNMVRDGKLRGDGEISAGVPWDDGNIGSGSGGSNRFYANFLLDGSPSGRENNFIQWFDVSSIPAGSTINSATLTVHLANQSANDRTWVDVNLSRLLPGKDWTEGVGQAPATDGSVTWAYQAAQTTLWDGPGATGAGDIDTGTTQTFDIVGVADQGTSVARDITAWVQAWVNSPANNTGMVWWGGKNDDSSSGNRFFWFGTKEDGAGPASESVAAGPTLVIDFTPVPEPTAALLLVAGLPLALRRRTRVAGC